MAKIKSNLSPTGLHQCTSVPKATIRSNHREKTPSFTQVADLLRTALKTVHWISPSFSFSCPSITPLPFSLCSSDWHFLSCCFQWRGNRWRRDEVGWGSIDQMWLTVAGWAMCLSCAQHRPFSYFPITFSKAFPAQLSLASYVITSRLHSVCFESHVGTLSEKSDPQCCLLTG